MSLIRQQRLAILTAVKQRVLRHHINIARVNLTEWTNRVDERASSLLQVELADFEAGVCALLSNLLASHTAFYHERDIRLRPQHSIGATLTPFDSEGRSEWAFLDVFDDGPAFAAGIKAGDVLWAVDGVPCVPPPIPTFTLARSFALALSSADGSNRREVTVAVPFRKGSKDRPPIVEPKPLSHRMIAPGVGLLKVLYFPGPMGLAFSGVL